MRLKKTGLALLALAAAVCFGGAKPSLAAKVNEGALRSDYMEQLADYAEWHPADTEFALTDIDGDKVRELVIAFTADDGNWQFDFFTNDPEEDGALWLGSYEQYADMYTPKRGDGLLAVIDSAGEREVERLFVEGGELVWEDYATLSDMDEDFEDGYLLVFNNVELFLEGGEKLSVLDSKEYIIPGSDSRYIDYSDLAGMDAATLRKARNEIYARRGRRFQSADLKTYFESKSWYRGTIPAEQFDDGVFNKYESANVAFILAVENGNISDDMEEEFDDTWYEDYYEYRLAKSNGKGKKQFEIFSDDGLEFVFGDGESFTTSELCDIENSNGSYSYLSEEGPTVVYWPGKQHAVQIVGSDDRDGYYYPED